MAPNSRNRPLVAIEQGGTAKAALDAVDRTIDSITRPRCFLVRDQSLINKWLKNNNKQTITLYIREGEI